MTTPDNFTLCLLGSPRRSGNSDTLAHRFCGTARTLGADVETVAVADLASDGCRNLFRCKTGLEHCGQSDDLTPVLKSVARARVLVLASPIYFTNITGPLKSVVDRMFSFLVPDYPTAAVKSRLGSGRTVVLVQSQGEPESRYPDLLDAYAAGFATLGFDRRFTVRAWGVREPGDVTARPDFLARCDAVARAVYG